MPIAMYTNEGVTVQAAMKAPKRVESIDHWQKEAWKALSSKVDVVNSWGAPEISTKSIVWSLVDDGLLIIDRTRNFLDLR